MCSSTATSHQSTEKRFHVQINFARRVVGGNNVRQIVCRGLENKVADMEVMEEFDPRPHQPVVLKVRLVKVPKLFRTCPVPQALYWE